MEGDSGEGRDGIAAPGGGPPVWRRAGGGLAAAARPPAWIAGAMLAAVALAGPAACGGGAGGPEPGAAVVVSVPPLADLVERLAGPGVEVEVMVPPGASPALYEPTVRQMRKVAGARLYVAVGHPRFPFERAWLGQIMEANPGMEVLRAGAGCRAEPEDPHLWLSPRCVTTMIDPLHRALREAGAGGRAGAAERRRALSARVDSVEATVRELLAPYRGRSFLVFHPALGYLARDYGLHQIAIQRGAREPGAGELAGVIRTAREQGIRTVFVQPQFSREAARLVAAELPGGRLDTVDPLAADWGENLVAIARALSDSFADRPAGAVR